MKVVITMSKLKYLYSSILGILNHFVLSIIPLISYYYLAPHQTHNFDPLHLKIFIIIINIALCIFLEKMLIYCLKYVNIGLYLF